MLTYCIAVKDDSVDIWNNPQKKKARCKIIINAIICDFKEKHMYVFMYIGKL